MPDAPFHSVSQDEKRRLRREAIDRARLLIDTDNVEDGARVLEYYRWKYGKSSDYFLRYGLAELFISDLFSQCCPHQARRVSHLIDEHLAECGSVEMERILRQTQLAMFRKYGDRDGEATCLRRLKALNQR